MPLPARPPAWPISMWRERWGRDSMSSLGFPFSAASQAGRILPGSPASTSDGGVLNGVLGGVLNARQRHPMPDQTDAHVAVLLRKRMEQRGSHGTWQGARERVAHAGGWAASPAVRAPSPPCF